MLLMIKIRLPSVYFGVAALLALLLLGNLMAACGRAGRYRVLNILFDDVPPLESTKRPSLADSSNQQTNGALSDTASATPTVWSFIPHWKTANAKPATTPANRFAFSMTPRNYV
jgi:hypothetical protein